VTAWLLTWLWQGTALAVSLSILLRLLPRVNASTRCMIWWGAFAALIWLGWESSSTTSSALRTASGATALIGKPSAIHVQPLPAWAITFIMTTWMAVASFRLLRILSGVYSVYRLKHECRPFSRVVEERLPLWHESKGRSVRLMLCDHLPGAAVLGLHEPYIAIPSSLVRLLAPHDLDQIILHEYGHVQRRDDWTRLLQALLESVFWIHPAARLIGRELNLEREVACDDCVIARTGAPRTYAACLSRVAETCRGRAEPMVAPALFGGNRDLVVRVDRLLDTKRNTRREPSFLVTALGASILGVLAVHLPGFPLVSEALTPVVSAAESGFRYAETIPVVSGFGGTRTVTVRLKASAADEVPSARPMADPAASVGAAATFAPFRHPASHPALGEPAIRTATPTLAGARSFEGVYQAADSRSAATRDKSSRWQALGTAAAGISSVARKTGVGIGATVSRASLSLAHSFKK
jgi:beta-lactamase regulating signal transducer with metallopeptidase domain